MDNNNPYRPLSLSEWLLLLGGVLVLIVTIALFARCCSIWQP